MKISDPKALKILRSIKMVECKESIETFPEEERNGESDLMIILNEVEYFKEFYEEAETVFNDDLNNARYILRRTQRGKFIPLDPVTFKPVYSQWDIQNAKNTVSEYVQLKALVKKLREMV